MNNNIYTIIESIRQGKCSLFIGSGVSTLCGIPSSQHLAKEIADYIISHFPDPGNKNIKDFEDDLCQISQLYVEKAKDNYAPHKYIQEKIFSS